MMPMTYVNGSLVGLMLGLVVLGLAIWAAVSMGRTASQPTAPPTPRQVLSDRFARGEIDAEEYRARLDVLSAPSGTRSEAGQ